MKRNIIFIVLFIYSSLFIFAQEGWIPVQCTSDFVKYSLYFTDQLNGFACDVQSIYRTTDSGINWFETFKLPAEIEFTDITFVDKLHGWCLEKYNLLLGTTDGGKTWDGIYTNSWPVSSNSIAFIDTFNGWVVGERSMILKTGDGGKNWERKILDAFQKKYDFNQIFWVDSINGWIVGGFGCILKTSDSGENWYQQDSLTNETLFSCYFINDQLGWVVGKHGKILHTTNGGTTWIFENSGSDKDLFKVFFTDDNNGWIVGEAGLILATKNGGLDWRLQHSIHTYDIQALFFIDSSKGWIAGGGAFISYTSTGGYTDVNDKLESLIKMDYYPNPINDNIHISFNLDKPSNVKLSINNLLGEEVAVLMNNYISQLQVDEMYYCDLPVGIYILNLKFDNKICSKILVK